MASALVKGASALRGGSSDGRLIEISHENVMWNCSSTRSDFREFIGGFIISACNMAKLKAMKLVLKALYFLAIGFHLWIMTARALHDLVDHKLRVTTNIEVSDP
jgi:hypothetical protein